MAKNTKTQVESIEDMDRAEVLVRRLANAVRAHAVTINDMHLAKMCDQAMDQDDGDAVDAGGYFLPPYVGELPETDESAVDDDDVPPAPTMAPAATRPTMGGRRKR
jgi:hypothetical protein